MTAAVADRETARAAAPDTALAHDVEWVPHTMVNSYLVGPPGAGSGEWVLIDTGMPFSGGTIRTAAAARFGPDSRPKAIVLTHAHFDHVGAVRELAGLWDVPVYAHRLELPYLTGRSDYPPPDPAVGGGMMAYLCRLYPRRGIDLGPRARVLPADGTVPGMPGWRWVHTPGHSPGHVSFFREADRFLIAGDAFVTTKQESAASALTRLPQEVRRPPAYFTTDWHQARNSVRALARLRPEVAATGHGIPMRGETMRRELEELADHFDRLAVPPVGRYVAEPARADETGTTYVPPPLVEPILGAVAALGIGAAVGWMTGRR
ncbi:MAG: fold metallo-hydrolase [Gemmataceae bacterium]|nr:fold metallo-hydrolase [Gemmataceae bacterium]